MTYFSEASPCWLFSPFRFSILSKPTFGSRVRFALQFEQIGLRRRPSCTWRRSSGSPPARQSVGRSHGAIMWKLSNAPSSRRLSWGQNVSFTFHLTDITVYLLMDSRLLKI